VSRTRIAVVGVGHLGRHHARLLKELDCELVAVADPSEKAREAAQQAYGVPAFADHRSLVGMVDAVSVVTPTNLHREVAGFFLEHGIDTLVEKPITATVEEGRELVEIARRHGRILQVGHVERLIPPSSGCRRSRATPATSRASVSRRSASAARTSASCST